MNFDEIRQEAERHIQEINQELCIIEYSEVMKASIAPDSGSYVTVTTKDGDTVDLSKILTDEQRIDLLEDIYMTVQGNIADAARKIEILTGVTPAAQEEDASCEESEPENEVAAEPEKEPEEEKLEEEEPEEEEPEEKQPSDSVNTKCGSAANTEKIELNYKKIKKLLEDGKSYNQVARLYGYASGKSIKQFVDKKEAEMKKLPETENITSTTKKAQEISEDEVRKLYTEGNMLVGAIAEHFGVSKKFMFAYIKEHKLERPAVL